MINLSNQTSSLVRDPNGALLQGFPKDFINQSIRCNLKFPRTQAVIQIAVARVILMASLEGRELEIAALYNDLKDNTCLYLNVAAVSDFVRKRHARIDMPIPEFPAERYNLLFMYEIRQGLMEIGVIGQVHYSGEKEPYKSLCAGIPDKPENLQDYKIEDSLEILRGLPDEFKQYAVRVLDIALKKLYTDPRPPEWLKWYVRQLETCPKEKRFLNVEFPYVSTVTKLAMSVIYDSVKEL